MWAILYAGARDGAELEALLVRQGAWKEWPLMVVVTPEGEGGGLQWMPQPEGAWRPLWHDGRVVGMAGCGRDGRAMAGICGLLPPAGLAPEAAAHAVLSEAAALLTGAGLGWNDVFRTWYYNDRILDWYGGFNRVRRDFFASVGVDRALPPASTGIGLANSAGRPLVFAALACEVKADGGPVPSPLQAEPAAYGSWFSRAQETLWDGRRTLWVSGTAAIDRAGRTVAPGDFDSQTVETCRVVEALLTSRGMAWKDVARATAYVRRGPDTRRWWALEAEGLVPRLPLVMVLATVCRDDLMFEIELEAVR